MKRLVILCLIVFAALTLSACGDKGKETFVPERIKLEDDCQGKGSYVVIDGECILIDQILSQYITNNESESLVQYSNNIELMSNFVADLSGSTGLAVIPRDLFESQQSQQGPQAARFSDMFDTYEEVENTDNLIAKLTENGFFEEVSFSDDQGLSVTITSNPLALEVFGAYTIIIFEVDLGYQNQNPDFTQKVYDSLYAGGVYLMHNVSGKLFATKNIEYNENVYSYQEDHSRNVQITVTLNEPVVEIQMVPSVDADGTFLFDENGLQLFEEVEVPVLDDEGNPIIITEGPILTEFQDVPMVNYFKEQQVDENGDALFDENGEPLYNIIEEPVLDENGNPVIKQMEFPVLDENGNVQYQQQFNVDFFIHDIREVTVTEYFAQVTDNALSVVAQRFVDQVLSEYYNWNYYRVNNYMISSWGFSASDEDIFFMNNKQDSSDPTKMERFVMRLSFDDVTNELLLEEYINATKAGFNECEIILDPRNNNIICDPWDGNIKVYSQTQGLKTIPDTENLQPVTFPNGDLYFYEGMETYVEELGYYTTLLYTINSDGTLQSSYIELGERMQLCQGADCQNYLNANMFDINGVQYATNGYVGVNIVRSDGEAMIEHADLELTSVGTFDSSRPVCVDNNGCWYYVQYELYDGEDYLGSFDGSIRVYPGEDVPDYQETYQLNELATIEYQQQWSQNDLVCTNLELGCPDYMYFIDESINTNGLWIYDNLIIQNGATFIDEIRLNETNNAVYDYTKDVTGVVCAYTICEENVQVRIYDENDQMLAQTYKFVEIEMGETVPLYIEYRITEDTVVTEKANVCTSSVGCWEYYETYDFTYYNISYQQGETMYQDIYFAPTDKTTINAETLTNELCTNIDGCWSNEVVYNIQDAGGVNLYTFSEYVYIEYGYKAPFTVTASLDDVTIKYQKEETTEVATCLEAICYQDINLSQQTAQGEEYLAWGNMTFALGEQLISRIILGADQEPSSSVNQQTCNQVDGCVMYTNDYTILDENGNVVPQQTEWYSSLPVFFETGAAMPIDEHFEATFTMVNVEYQMSRLYVNDFIHNLNNVVILDENLYLIERSSWTQGEDNVILSYNETTNRYIALYTNLSAITEITKLGDGYVAINDDETAILQFDYNLELSNNNYYYFDVTNLTDGLSINGVTGLIIDYDGSIYFSGVDNFIQDITGTITDEGVVTIDTEFTEHVVIRISPIN